MEIQASILAELTQLATGVAARAYTPYSRFRVGAAVLLTGGEQVAGCNVENVSYRLTCCAEQTAITAAVAQHGPSIRVAAVVVVNLNGAACSPCGACRQVLFEFSSADTLVIFPGEHGRIIQRTMADLLPSAFAYGAPGEPA